MWIGSVDDAAGCIDALIDGGMTLGVDWEVNKASTTYYWFALKADTGVFAVGKYTGDGNDNRDITGLGFQPDVVCVKRNAVQWGFTKIAAESSA